MRCVVERGELTSAEPEGREEESSEAKSSVNGLNGDSVTSRAFRDSHVLIPRRSRHAIVISSNLRRYVIGRRLMDAEEAQGWTGHCLQCVCRQLSLQHVLIP